MLAPGNVEWLGVECNGNCIPGDGPRGLYKMGVVDP